jgi:hypothetical protein
VPAYALIDALIKYVPVDGNVNTPLDTVSPVPVFVNDVETLVHVLVHTVSIFAELTKLQLSISVNPVETDPQLGALEPLLVNT